MTPKSKKRKRARLVLYHKWLVWRDRSRQRTIARLGISPSVMADPDVCPNPYPPHTLGMAPEICTLCAAKWREMEEMSREYAARLADAWRKAVERQILEGGDSRERNPEA